MLTLLRDDPAAFAILIVLIVLSLTVHEFAHSLTAIRLGDDTPRRQGRLTLNPLAHIDPIGFVLLVVAGFGWAKPVQFNPGALRKPQRDEILIAVAGPASNLLLAVIFGLLAWATSSLVDSMGLDTARAVFGVVTQAAVINVSLAIFNMLPIPPLDGSHLVTTWLARFNTGLAATYFRYGSFLLLAFIVFEQVSKITLLPISAWTYAIVTAFYRLLGIL